LEIQTLSVLNKGTVAEILKTKVKGGRVLRLTDAASHSQALPQIVSVDIAENAGATPLEMMVRLIGGRTFNLLGSGNAESIEKKYQDRVRAGDPYAGNVFFQPGAMAPLIGLANRLTGEVIAPGVIEATVLGHKVHMPLNHGLNPGQRPHHLHGVGFDQATEVSTHEDRTGVHLRAEFAPGFHEPYWTGRFGVTVDHSLKDGVYCFEMECQNAGDTAVPLGAGAHPYFVAPSGDPEAVKLLIPGRRIVEIDNYENVLPTGRILEIESGSRFHFHQPGGRHLHGQYLDNLWVDLETDANGYAFAEFIDLKAQLRLRMTALTQNIIGIQVFAPQPAVNSDLGVFAAIEFVTNLPDPREELWKNTPTGMALIQPGQSLKYGYKIEAFAL